MGKSEKRNVTLFVVTGVLLAGGVGLGVWQVSSPADPATTDTATTSGLSTTRADPGPAASADLDDAPDIDPSDVVIADASPGREDDPFLAPNAVLSPAPDPAAPTTTYRPGNVVPLSAGEEPSPPREPAARAPEPASQPERALQRAPEPLSVPDAVESPTEPEPTRPARPAEPETPAIIPATPETPEPTPEEPDMPTTPEITPEETVPDETSPTPPPPGQTTTSPLSDRPVETTPGATEDTEGAGEVTPTRAPQDVAPSPEPAVTQLDEEDPVPATTAASSSRPTSDPMRRAPLKPAR